MAAALLKTAQDLILREENINDAEKAANEALKSSRDKKDTKNMAEALRCRALLKLIANDVDGALEIARGEASAFESQGDKAALAMMKAVQAEIMVHTEEFEEARTFGDAALQLLDQAGEKEPALNLLCRVMVPLYMAKQERAAMNRCANRALELAEQLGDPISKGSAQSILMHARLLTQSREAVEAGRRGLQLFHEAGDKENEAKCMHVLATVHLGFESPLEAAASAQTAMALYIEVGAKKQAAACLKTLSQAHIANNAPKEAVRLVETELAKAQRSRDRRMESLIIPVVLFSHVANNAHDVAARKAKASLKVYQEVDDRAGEAGVLRTLAELQYAMGQLKEAEMAAKTAAALYQDMHDRKGEEAALFVLDHICVAKGEPDEAPHRAEALSLLREMARTLDDRNAAEFKEVVRRFHNVGGTTQQDIEEIFNPVMEKDEAAAKRFIKEHTGGNLFGTDGGKEEGGKEGDTKLANGAKMVISQVEHKQFYLGFRTGGLGYGPRFRIVKFPWVVSKGLDVREALAVVRCSSEGESWENELLFHPGILDGALQTGAAQGHVK